MSYCDFCADKPAEHLHKIYHDQKYGFPLLDDDELFGRLILEINQAGLSWDTMLKKEENFRKAFDSFSIQKIANYSETKIEELLNDAGIIRNKLKVNAVIYNAKQIVTLQKEQGSFAKWLETNDPLTKIEWVKLFKKHFKFVGGEIVGEFLMSIGLLKGAHVENCPIFNVILSYEPSWKKYEE
ncbi:MAG: DNA-3-methyladenine glycosylase I [Bacteroidota bacterium]